MPANRPYFTFRCDAFNTSDARPEYERPDNYGDDVTSWLADRLAEHEWETDDELEQDTELGGWSINFRQGRDEFNLHVSTLNPAEARWLAWISCQFGFFGRLFGAGDREVPDDVLRTIHEILTSDPLVGEVRWHTRQDFRSGNLDDGAIVPC